MRAVPPPPPGPRRHRLRAAVALVLTLLTGVLAAAAADGRGAATPRCAGAAARVPGHPCVNPALRTTATPSPEDALLVPDAPCTVAGPEPDLDPCLFGRAPGEPAAATVALLGDSHASHWRAALAVAAARSGWRGVSLTKSSCPFSAASARIAPEARVPCHDHNRAVVAYLSAHPEIRTVVVSAHAGARVLHPAGRGPFATKIAGYHAAWATLPASVRHIVVLRDMPIHPLRTTTCVEDAVAAGLPPGTTCAVSRRGALLPDAEAVAAARGTDPRARVIDLTPFVCDATRCFPVVGGVLVNKDADHLTRAFSASLGPYLLQALAPIVTAR